ncbi:pepsin-like aspartyl protease [Flavobacteriaceae bacterium]|nr:pepsin-like aspartyl protease [Flavobacteriaceae bacterium]
MKLKNIKHSKLITILILVFLFVNCHAQENALKFETIKGPYQTNGASPWYTLMSIGTPSQENFKTIFDTGGNFAWITSTQCLTEACTQKTPLERIRFDMSKSSSFSWNEDCTASKKSWGPWGDMYINRGSDNINFLVNSETKKVPVKQQKFIQSIYYEGEKFIEMNWDAGFGFPSSSKLSDIDTPSLLENLLNQGQIKPDSNQNLLVSFYSNPVTKEGHVLIGTDFDQDLVDLSSALVLPFQPYIKSSGIEYLWTTPLKSWSVGEKIVAQPNDNLFCLDSGSSRFKGDSAQLSTSLKLIDDYYTKFGKYPSLNFNIGDDDTKMISITPDLYRVKVDEGIDKGKTVTAITTSLNIDDLILVGSVVMDNVYTVYRYKVTHVSSGKFSYTPLGMVLYNKKDGPKIIQDIALEEEMRTPAKIEIYPNPSNNGVFNIRVHLTKQLKSIYARVYDSNGREISLSDNELNNSGSLHSGWHNLQVKVNDKSNLNRFFIKVFDENDNVLTQKQIILNE